MKSYDWETMSLEARNLAFNNVAACRTGIRSQKNGRVDRSLTARKQLAQELHYTGDTNDSAALNVWLHRQVMTKLAENGGKVPDELRHSA
jgi:Domain of unknown function (DUF3597)